MQSESPNPQPVKMRHNFYNIFSSCCLAVVVSVMVEFKNIWQAMQTGWELSYLRRLVLCVCFVHWMECHPFCWNSFESVYWKTNLMTLFIRNKQWTPSTQVFFSLLSIHLSWIWSSFVLPAKKAKQKRKILISFSYLFNLAFQFNAYCCCTLSRSRITLHTHAVWVRSMKV